MSGVETHSRQDNKDINEGAYRPRSEPVKEKGIDQIMEEWWEREVKIRCNGFLDNGDLENLFGEKNGKKLDLVRKKVDFDNKPSFLGESLRRSWGEFYGQKLSSFNGDKLDKTISLMNELNLVKDCLLLPWEMDPIKKKNLFSDILLDINYSDTVRPNKKGIFEYRKYAFLIGKTIDELKKIYPINEETVVKVLSKNEEVIKNPMIISIINEENKKGDENLFTIGLKALDVIKNIKKNGLMSVIISEDLAELLNKSGSKKINEIVSSLETTFEKQNEIKKYLMEFISLKLNQELLEDEEKEIKNNEVLKSGEGKKVVYKELCGKEKKIDEVISGMKIDSISKKVVKGRLVVKIKTLTQSYDENYLKDCESGLSNLKNGIHINVTSLKTDIRDVNVRLKESRIESKKQTKIVQKIIDSLPFEQKELDSLCSDENSDPVYFGKMVKGVIARGKLENKLNENEIKIIHRKDELLKMAEELKNQMDNLNILMRNHKMRVELGK